MNNFKKYLPSKKFVSILLIIIIFMALFFAIKGIVSLFKNKKTDGKPISMTIGTPESISQKDSNNNGIADWEEYLWGLDPNKNGPENKEFISAKKKQLAQSGEISPIDDSQTITNNELLSQQFLATVVSLQLTGDLNEESMKSVSEALGKNVEAIPIPDVYTSKMLTIQNDSTLTNTAYRNALSKLITKYIDADIGSELTFIVQGLSNKDPQALYAAVTVAEAYQSFGKEFVKIPVPRSLSTAHLSMANNYEKIGQTIRDLAQILSDPIIGMRAIISYKQYSDALSFDQEKISEILQ